MFFPFSLFETGKDKPAYSGWSSGLIRWFKNLKELFQFEYML